MAVRITNVKNFLCLRIKSLFFNLHDVMKIVGGAKKCRILATTNFYMYTVFLDCFSVLFVKILCELSEIRGTKRLFIDIFGHDVQQPSP